MEFREELKKAIAETTDGIGGALASSAASLGVDSSTTFSVEGLSESSPLDRGEGSLLLSALEDEEPIPEIVNAQLSFENEALHDLEDSGVLPAEYGCPLSAEHAAEKMPDKEGGLLWNATIVPDEYFADGKLMRGLKERDFDYESQTIKPRRPTLPVTVSDFFNSLTKIEGNKNSRWVFHGILNGWPSLTCLELLSLKQKRKSSSIASPRDILTGQVQWKNYWNVDKEGKDNIDPEIDQNDRGIYLAQLREAPWSGHGWSQSSPGFAFWFEAMHPEEPRLSYGTNMLKAVGDAKCTHVHMISHRYAVSKESPKDLLTYHSLVLLEWDHGLYCTVVEGAYLNGLGGYKGKCNWYEDKDEPVTALYRVMPPEMVAPWVSTSCEIRFFDVPQKNLEELKTFIEKHEGLTERFIDPRFTFSHKARLTYRSRSHIAQYILNYIGRDFSYHELKRNCQTFAADLCSFLAGKKRVEPFHPVNRIEYRNRTHLFMYDSDMYD